MELKLILLVRDPRSIYHSRKKMAMSIQKKESLSNTRLWSSNCFSMRDCNVFNPARRLPAVWQNGKYPTHPFLLYKPVHPFLRNMIRDFNKLNNSSKPLKSTQKNWIKLLTLPRLRAYYKGKGWSISQNLISML